MRVSRYFFIISIPYSLSWKWNDSPTSLNLVLWFSITFTCLRWFDLCWKRQQWAMAEDKGTPDGESKESSPPLPVVKKKGKGVLSLIWNAIFRIHGDDFEKRLEHISKEEAAVLARMKSRSLTWRRMIRHLIVFSVIMEVPTLNLITLSLCLYAAHCSTFLIH